MNNKLEKTRAEKILEDIENYLRSLITERKKLEFDYQKKLSEIDKQRNQEKEWFRNEVQEGKRIENKLILLWDYWKREVEILGLERKIQNGILPSERGEIMKKMSELNKHNLTIEKGFKNRSIDKEIVVNLRKKLGIWNQE